MMSLITSFRRNTTPNLLLSSHMKQKAVNRDPLVRVCVRCIASFDNLGHEKTADVKTLDSIPGPKIWPVLGNLEHLRDGFRSSHLIHREMAKKHGRFFKDGFLGHKLAVVAYPDIAEIAYRAEENNPFRDTGPVFSALFDARNRLSLPKGLPELLSFDEFMMSLTTSFRRNTTPNLLLSSHMKQKAVNRDPLVRVCVRRIASFDNLGHDKTADVKTLDSIPGPKIWPVLGNLEHLRDGFRTFHLSHREMAKKHGRFFKDGFLGHKLAVVAYPDIAEIAYRAEENNPFRDTGPVFSALFDARNRLSLPKGLPELQGEEWAEIRRIFNKHLLKPINIKNYYPGFSEVAADAVEILNQMRDKDNVVQDVLKKVLEKWSMESIGTFVFGQRVGLLSNPPNQRGLKTYEGMSSTFATSYKLSKASWLKYFYPFEYRQFQKNVAELFENGTHFVNNVFEHFKQSEEKGTPISKDIETSFVAYLMKKDSMTANECATHAIDTYAAGLDTTSLTAFWLMYWLGLNPDKQEKLFKEVKQNITNDNTVSASNIQKMPYLRACFKESARLTPTVPALARMLKEDIVLEGYNIPAKTIIVIHNYVMGRDEELFHDANSFIPERWLRENAKNEKNHLFASRPFGFGPRSCVGKQVAEAEMQVFISLLVKKFRFEFIGEKLNGKNTLFLEPERPPSFAFYDR